MFAGLRGMGDGTEPREDDLLAMADALQAARQQVARLRAENAALKEAWVRVSNFDRFDFRNAIESLYACTAATEARALLAKIAGAS